MKDRHTRAYAAGPGQTRPAAPATDVHGMPVAAVVGLSEEEIWSTLITEPGTGVSIISADGLIIWLNDQAARIGWGKDAHAGPYIGKTLADVLPPQLAEERLSVLRSVAASEKPALLRSIHRGWQVHSWIQHVESGEADAEPARALPDRFLVISRRVCSMPDAKPESPVDYDLVESRLVNLGPLDPLTPRELEVLALIGQGLSMKAVAATLHRSIKTIDNHRASIGRKLALDDRVQLAEIARRAGLTLADAERQRV